MERKTQINLSGVTQLFWGIMVHPVKDDGKEIEVCKEKEADYYSVYTANYGGTETWIADCETIEEARTLQKNFMNFLKSFKE